MFRVRVTPSVRAKAVIAAGGGAMSGGTWTWFGQGPGLLLAGVLAVLYGLIVMSVDGG